MDGNYVLINLDGKKSQKKRGKRKLISKAKQFVKPKRKKKRKSGATNVKKKGLITKVDTIIVKIASYLLQFYESTAIK